MSCCTVYQPCHVQSAVDLRSPGLARIRRAQHACVTAVTPVEISSSYKCAVNQRSCTAALVRARCIPHCSVLLCRTGPQQALCQCSYTCGVLRFMKVCSEPTFMHCSTGQGKVHSPLLSVALQNRLTAGIVSMQLHLWSSALHTGVQ